MSPLARDAAADSESSIDGRIPRLGHGVRLRLDKVTQRHLLLRPEQGFELRGSAVDIVRLCDGTRTVEQIVETLSHAFATAAGDPVATAAGRAKIAGDVRDLLRGLAARRLVDLLPGAGDVS